MLKILITNDDGPSQGVDILAKHLSKYGLIWVSIPARHMSAKSHSISTNSTINFLRLEQPVSLTEDTILVDGTPVDSVKLGISEFRQTFDVCISGINDGENLAKDIIYSGTVAAAREAYISNIPSVSLSISNLNNPYLEENLEIFLKYYFEKELYKQIGLVNVNLPQGKAQGVKFTTLGQRLQFNQFTKLNNNQYRLDRSFLQYKEDEKTDIYQLQNNFISITPLTLDQTDYQKLKGLNKLND